MPDHTPSRHASRKQDRSRNSQTTKETSPRRIAAWRFELITKREAQELRTTTSRQLRRSSDFLAATRYMVRHHPKAGPTTIRLATVFASRMHRSQHGHVPFNIAATVRELGLSRRTILNHTRYLRELGLIVWVEHGSKRNVLRTRRSSGWHQGDGYCGTATLYAPVAPPAWDRQQGHRIRGRGYRARLIGFTAVGRERAIAAVRRSVRAKRKDRRCTPSLVGTSAPSRQQVVASVKKNTARVRLPNTLVPAHGALTPAECRAAILLAERVQREVWWLFDACSRRLAYALRPLIQAGWISAQLAGELATWGVPVRLQDAAAYIHHEVRRRQRLGELPPTLAAFANAPRADDGARYDAMLHDRARRTPAWERYVEQARPQLRADLAEQRQRRRALAAAAALVYRPVLREPEEAFLASLPSDSWVDAPTPREIYAARAHRRTADRGRVLPATDDAWQEHLRDHAAAAQACEILRAQWASEAFDVPNGAVDGGPDDPGWRDARE
ncbi:hypothetical protein OHB41_49450 [Streptomyces sp. NBC_01571]|uniref:hypothetical protein n=1 Tax=Streptomyces sp. NBC_01571 TaxID=2975883 RepID=UPI00225435E9|nr:hypothetical protein [Streptomyces sp. NBC_01571]MCX4580989.1 hypothetical protein [Streptomyces sp. NBC_01571]